MLYEKKKKKYYEGQMALTLCEYHSWNSFRIVSCRIYAIVTLPDKVTKILRLRVRERNSWYTCMRITVESTILHHVFKYQLITRLTNTRSIIDVNFEFTDVETNFKATLSRIDFVINVLYYRAFSAFSHTLYTLNECIPRVYYLLKWRRNKMWRKYNAVERAPNFLNFCKIVHYYSHYLVRIHQNESIIIAI